MLVRSLKCFAMLVLSSSISCRHVPVDASFTKHEFQKMSSKDVILEDCKAMLADNESMAEISERYQSIGSSKFKYSDEYLRKIFQKIVVSNPKTFIGKLSAEKFCIHVGRSPQVNASGIPGTGLILFSDSIFASFETDADVASVMAHEAAHITLDHKDDSLHPKLRNNNSYRLMKEAVEAYEANSPIKAEITGEIEKLQILIERVPTYAGLIYESLDVIDKSIINLIKNPEPASKTEQAQKYALDNIRLAFKTINESDASMAIMSRLVTLSRKLEQDKINRGLDIWQKEYEILGSEHQEILANWMEQEADEVGYEMYLRAGFKESEYGKKYRAQLRKNSEGVIQCKVAEGTTAGSSLERITRGKDSHPTNCWRGFNIEVSEKQVHKSDYKDLLPNATVETYFPGDLTKAINSLK